MNRLRNHYHQEILPSLVKEFDLGNDMAAPRLQKLIINVGVTDQQHRDKAIENVSEQIAAIAGQKPVVRTARKSIASFKLRQGDLVGVSVTLRGERMYQFLDKLINIVLPRVKDFQGVPLKSFDGNGNYNLGLQEQIVFPEINYDKIDVIRGMQITLVTSTSDDRQSEQLLRLLGVPFEKPETH